MLTQLKERNSQNGFEETNKERRVCLWSLQLFQCFYSQVYEYVLILMLCYPSLCLLGLLTRAHATLFLKSKEKLQKMMISQPVQS